MFCIKCGQQLADGDRFCTHCGAKVEAASEKVQMKPFAPVKIPESKNAEEPVKIPEPKPAAESVHETPVPTQKPAPAPVKAEEKPVEMPAAKQPEAPVKKQKEKPEREKTVEDQGAILLLAMLGTNLFPYILKSAALYVRKQTLTVPMAVGLEILAYVIAGVILLFGAKKFSEKLQPAKVLQFLGTYAGAITVIDLLPAFLQASEPIKSLIVIGISLVIVLAIAFVMLSAAASLFTEKGYVCRKGRIGAVILIGLALISKQVVSDILVLVPVEYSFLSTSGVYMLVAFVTAGWLTLAVKKLLAKKTQQEESIIGGLIPFVVGAALAVLAAGVSFYRALPVSALDMALTDVETYFLEAEYALAVNDMNQATLTYEKAFESADMWETIASGGSCRVDDTEDSFISRYLDFLCRSVSEQRKILAVDLTEEDIPLMCPVLLKTYAEEQKDDDLDENEKEHQKELIALCIAHECFVAQYPDREAIEKCSDQFADFSEVGDSMNAHFQMAESLGSLQKGDMNLDSLTNQLLSLAEEYPDDISVQFMTAKVGTMNLHDGAWHYERTGEVILQYDALWMKENKETASEKEIASHCSTVASLLATVQQYEQAVAYSEKAGTLVPQSNASILQTAGYYLKNGDAEKSYEMCRKLSQEMQDDSALLWTYCISALKSEHPEEAVEAAGKLADLVLKSEGEDVNRAGALLMNCVQYLAMNDHTGWTDYGYRIYDDEEMEESVANLFYANSFLNNFAAAVYWSKGVSWISTEYDMALDYVEKALEQKPDLSQLYYTKGMILYSMERFEEAKEAYLKADELYPNDTSTLFALANTFDALEDYQTAFGYCERVLNMHPEGVNHSIDWYGAAYHARGLYGSLKIKLEQEGNE